MLHNKVVQWSQETEANLEPNLSHFTIRKFRDSRINEYCERMSKDSPSVVVDWTAVKYLEEQGFSSALDQLNIEPRSVYTVSKLYSALEKFSPGKINDVKIDEAVQSGIDLAWKVFSRPKDKEKVKPLDVSLEMINMITTNLTASAGLTDYTMKKGDSMVKALNRANRIIEGTTAPKPCLAFSRTQKNRKTRLVWGYPYEMTIIEGIFARFLYDQFKVSDTPLAFGKTSLILGCRIKTASRRKKYTYSVDMSSYDSSLANNLIEVAFNILKTWFKLDRKSSKAWNIVKKYFICTPIVMPDHNLYLGKRHGVPSGSYFTQLIDSIVNVIICGAISKVFNMNVSDRDIMVLGDDLIFFSDTKVDMERMASKASKLFGVNFNAEKSQFVINKDHNTIHYLGRYWSNCTPDIPYEEILNKVVFPERYRRYSNKENKRAQEVRNLIASYCFTYKSAYMLLKYYDDGGWRLPFNQIESNLLGKGEIELDDKKLSGLLAFYMKEGIIDRKTGVKSLFQLFWN